MTGAVIFKIEVCGDGNRFTEFTIVLKNPYEKQEYGRVLDWAFLKDGSGTKIKFTEEVEVASPITNLFVIAYLKKIASNLYYGFERSNG